MKKIDLTKTEKSYYQATPDPGLVQLKAYDYLTIQGVSSPEAPIFTDSIASLYAVAYGIKFFYKSAGKDFVVPKLEGQWWVEGQLPFDQTPRDQWHWRLMIPLPGFATPTAFNQVLSQVARKKKLDRISQIKWESLNEGRSVQILHVGSYENEAASIEKIIQFIQSSGLLIDGRHHEIYITDPQRTPVERLKTIIRYPVKETPK